MLDPPVPDGLLSTLSGVANPAWVAPVEGRFVSYGPAGASVHLSPFMLGLSPEGDYLTADEVLRERVIRVVRRDGSTSRVPFGQETYDPTYTNGQAATATWGVIQSVHPDGRGGLVAIDYTYQCLRRLSWPDMVSTTIAGMPPDAVPEATPSSRDGLGSEARFTRINACAVGRDGTIYVAEGGSYSEAEAGAGFRVRKVSPGGQVTTLAGSKQGFADGKSAEASFEALSGIAADDNGYVYVSDSWNDAIRQISPDGTVTTLTGSTAESRNPADGAGTEAKVVRPGALTIGPEGDVYLMQGWDGTLRKME